MVKKTEKKYGKFKTIRDKNILTISMPPLINKKQPYTLNFLLFHLIVFFNSKITEKTFLVLQNILKIQDDVFKANPKEICKKYEINDLLLNYLTIKGFLFPKLEISFKNSETAERFEKRLLNKTLRII